MAAMLRAKAATGTWVLRPVGDLAMKVTIITAVIGLFLATFVPRAFCQQPDPAALLRGAEQARRAVESGIVEFTVEEVFRRRVPLTTKVRLVFSGDLRTTRFERDEFEFADAARLGTSFDELLKRMEALDHDMEKAQLAGLGTKRHRTTTWMFDGTQFCQYHADAGMDASYREMGRDGEYVFDPRMLGIVPLYRQTEGLSFAFSNPAAKNIKTIGKELIGSVAVWHVQYDAVARCHFWIEDRDPFRVHRVEYEELLEPQNDYRTTIQSDFTGIKGPLPMKVHIKTGSPTENELDSRLVVSVMRLDEPVDSDVGTLNSLGLPDGTQIIDTLSHKFVGVWNGEQPVAHEAYSEQKRDEASKAASNSRKYWGIGSVSGSLLLVCCLAYLYWRRNRNTRSF
jgi:hypothetical protein